MIEKIWEFLFPSNSNAKNRNTVFVWFLLCFILAMVIAFYNGYFLGKCKCDALQGLSSADSAMVLRLNSRIKTIEEDSIKKQNDLNQFGRIINESLYEKFQNSNDPIELIDLYKNLINSNISDSVLRSGNNIIAQSIKYKSDIIAGLNDTINNLREYIIDQKKKIRKLDN